MPKPAAPHNSAGVAALIDTRDLLPDPRPAGGMALIFWRLGRLVDWSILLLAILNLALVFFDFSYMTVRHQYLKVAPGLVAQYDKIKGIEPHRSTHGYLQAADRAFALALEDPGSPAAAEAEAAMGLASVALVDEDPFSAQGLRGAFEQWKSQGRKRMGQDSSKGSWKAFWSPTHLSDRQKIVAEKAWFDAKVRPLLAQNFYRHYGEDGQPIDHFKWIDLAFMPIFLLEFAVRGVVGVRRGRYRHAKAFFEARWYDAVYALPLVGYLLPAVVVAPLHLVRVVSVAQRMQRLGLINPLRGVQRQAQKVLDAINLDIRTDIFTDLQADVQRLDLADSLQRLSPEERKILTRWVERNLVMGLTRVLPEVQPELEALVAAAVRQAITEAPAYKELASRLPFLGDLPNRVIPAMVGQVAASSQSLVAAALTDPANQAAIDRLIDAVMASLLRHEAEVGTDVVKGIVVNQLEEEKRRIQARFAAQWGPRPPKA